MPKAKNRRGRKRRVDAERHPSGQVVRKSPEERASEARQVAQEARTRVFGLSPDQAAKQEASTALGRAVLRGELSGYQLAAAGEYVRIVREFQATILAKEMPSPMDLNRQGGYDNDDGTSQAYVAECRRAKAAMDRCRRALMDACTEHRDPLIQFAVNTWALDDEEAWNLFASAKLGLNALGRVLNVEQWLGAEKAA